MQTIELTPEPMRAASFAAFGEVFGAVTPAASRQMVPTRFEHDGAVTMSVIWQPASGRRFSRLERHFGVTQAFVQLSGAPAVVCVAPATDASDTQAFPAPESIRAFSIDPALGYMFHRGTWHSLDRYLLAEPSAAFLIVNVAPNPTQIVDFATGSNEMHADLDTSGAQSLPAYAGQATVFEVKP